jgi:integrase
LRLRVKDIDFINQSIFVFRGKGGKDRYTLLPQSLAESIKNQMSIAKKCHDKDMCEGLAWHLFPLPLHSLESMVMLLNK